jgi:uncharacterized protein
MTRRAEIQKYASELASTFHPRRIILFGSYARGDASEDSDVDLLVIMDRFKDADEEAIKMRLRIPRSFPVDLLVKRSSEMTRRAAAGSGFARTVLQEGKLLYERRSERVG